MIVEISKIYNSITPKWVFFLSDGKVLNTSLENKELGKMLRILKAVINEIEVGSVFIVRELIIYRVTFNLFTFLIGNVQRNLLKDKLTDITKKYRTPLENKYDSIPAMKEINVNLVLFSMGLDEGPTPITHLPKDYDDEKVFKVCMKSMLLLSVESEGANKEMVSFQPYIELDSLGIVYLFHIEDENARGNAYDSAITILVDYADRAIIYENYTFIESLLKDSVKNLKREYYSSKDYNRILQFIQRKLTQINFESIQSEDLKAEMQREIKKLAKL
ncbi:MAG: hypothetical protein ACTSR8_05230 [Promethearchaeota archaeon]